MICIRLGNKSFVEQNRKEKTILLSNPVKFPCKPSLPTPDSFFNTEYSRYMYVFSSKGAEHIIFYFTCPDS